MKHHIPLRDIPDAWHKGLPLGNGEFGVMAWGDGHPLAFTLDRADLWDLRSNTAFRDDPRYTYAELRRLVAKKKFAEAKEIFEDRELRDNPVGPTKISIGRAEIDLGAMQLHNLTLDIDHAILSGRLRQGRSDKKMEAFVHRGRNALCIRLCSGLRRTTVGFKPVADFTPALAALGHPAPSRATIDGVRVVTQQIPRGPAWAVAWIQRDSCLFLTAETASDTDTARARAVHTAVTAAKAGYALLRREHSIAWNAFWRASAVQLPEPDLERMWYYGLYLLASSAKRGFPAPGLQGLWAMDGVLPPWRGDYHADMNVQETFWPAGAAGHLELLDTWCDGMLDGLPKAREFTRRFFGTEGAFWLACTLPGYTQVPCWYTAQFAWSHTGWLSWLVWLRWRYSMDADWLRDTGYPLVAEAFRFFRANLETGEDGRLHIPLSSSPEYGSDEPRAFASDPNIDIALIRRCCDWLVEMEKALHGIPREEALTNSARDIRKRLTPYALSERGELLLWPGKPLDESHRHPSHLMAIHPAMDLTLEGGKEARRIIGASIRQYHSLGSFLWAGHSHAQLASMAAVIGRSGWAWHSLRTFRDMWCGDNGLHFNADQKMAGVSTFGYGGYPPGQSAPFTMESNCGIAMGICDMLVQGWNDIVRVFPAVPDHWREVSFRDLRTEGAFRVSAERRHGRTVHVSIVAGVDRELRLRDPFGESPVHITGPSCRRKGGYFRCRFRRGERLTIRLSATQVNQISRSRLTINNSPSSKSIVPARPPAHNASLHARFPGTRRPA